VQNIFRLLAVNFLGQSPTWYKITILSFLILNPIVYCFSPFVAGWMVLIEFIFALACALKCYPLQPGGLIALEALVIGLTDPATIYKEVLVNAPTLLLLIFMVSAIYFIKDVLYIAITKLFLAIRRKHILSLVFCMICAGLSAFLDAITLVAIAIAVCFNFYAIFHRVASESDSDDELDEFRGFLRNLIIHGTVGTVIGGAMTEVGEPQNIMIGTKMGWDFMEFIVQCGPVSVPAVIAGFIVCFSVEFFRCPGFRYQMSEHVRGFILKDYQKKMNEMTGQNFYVYTVQVFAFILLVFALAFHIAEVGLIGIGLIVLVTSFTGLTKEHDIGGAFVNAMPFAVLIVVFFAILGVVHSQHLVTPLAEWVFRFEDPKAKLLALYFTNGSLSFVSDNVFIATVFITEVEAGFVNGIIAQMLSSVDFNVQNACANGNLHQAVAQYLGHESRMNLRVGPENDIITHFIREVNAIYQSGIANNDLSAFNAYVAHCADKPFISREEVERLAIVVNMGTNLPAMATPNGHAALLFLLTSALAPLLRLSYLKMVLLTLPYTIAVSLTGALAIYFFV